MVEKLSNLSKAEKKNLKQAVKEYRKQLKKADSGKGVQDKKALDHDLKMAIIFGAVAVVLSTLSGFSYVFWIVAVVSLVIGLVFLIKWLSRQ